MGKLIALFSILFLIGCADSYNIRVESGTTATDNGLMNKELKGETQRLIVGSATFFASWKNVDVGIGPSTSIPLTGDAPGVGGQVWIRPRISIYDLFDIYFVTCGGIDYYHSKWAPQGTYWGFPFQVGPGVRVPVPFFSGVSATLDYRLWHESNGSRYFGNNNEPNPGFNCDVVMFGLEFKL
jgi:hypothetical protein